MKELGDNLTWKNKRPFFVFKKSEKTRQFSYGYRYQELAVLVLDLLSTDCHVAGFLLGSPFARDNSHFPFLCLCISVQRAMGSAEKTDLWEGQAL